MNNISIIGVDISRTVFQIHAADKDGRPVLRKRCDRQQFVEFMGDLTSCEVGMEACAGSHFWGRRLAEMGHKVKLIPPQYVKPYVKRNKNDAADAEAIVEAMSRPTMRFVEIKTVGQQEMNQLHRARDLLVKQRTAYVNEIKGFLHEYGVVLRCSHEKLREEYLKALERVGAQLGEVTKRLMERLFEQLKYTSAEIRKHELEIGALHKNNEVSQRLESIPGVGVLTATAIVAAVGDPGRFKSGRDFAASLGLTPRQHSSGQHERLGKISKRGDAYIRKLMIQGGHTVVMHVNKAKGYRAKWVRDLVERRGRQKAVVAVANKNARIIWALMSRGGKYNDAHGGMIGFSNESQHVAAMASC
jgi:transposase